MRVSVAAADRGFLAHVGPIETAGGLSSLLQLQPHHLNIGARFHGGMLLTFATAAFERMAGHAAAQRAADARVRLLSLDVQFISAATCGDTVRADVALTRITRTMVFLTARLCAGAQCLATAAAVYSIHACDPTDHGQIPADGLAAPDLTGWTEALWREPFSRHVGSVHERLMPEGTMAALFEVNASRLCADEPVMHDGMGLFIADVFTGRAAVRAAAQRCVTLSMQVRRMGDAPVGTWVQFEPAVRQLSPSVVFADGLLSCAGRPVMTVASVWKILGAS